MNILLCSVPFRPSVGGIETVSALLAEQFHRLGHSLSLLTQTASPDAETGPYTVVRRPNAWRLAQLVRAADVVLHNSISLRLAWPLAIHRRPWVVAHHIWIPRSGPGAVAGRAKHGVLRLAHNVAVSHAVAADLRVPSVVIPNPYDDRVFRRIEGLPRTRDIAFVGRLIDDKGVPVLLHALAALRASGITPSLSIIGSGPEEAPLRALVQQLGLGAQASFAGRLEGAALALALNAHRVVVVPSVWEEPFGLVALEAQACGCIPVVAASGGLPEAAGPAGVVFAKGDSAALATCLAALVGDAGAAASVDLATDLRAARHLARHRPERVALAYLDVLQHARCQNSPLVRAA